MSTELKALYHSRRHRSSTFFKNLVPRRRFRTYAGVPTVSPPHGRHQHRWAVRPFARDSGLKRTAVSETSKLLLDANTLYTKKMLCQTFFQLFLVRAGRIELPTSAWKAVVLPLNYDRMLDYYTLKKPKVKRILPPMPIFYSDLPASVLQVYFFMPFQQLSVRIKNPNAFLDFFRTMFSEGNGKHFR